MADEKVSQLPTVTGSALSDVIYAIQNGVSVQETLQQVFDLVLSNTILFGSTNPNGNVAGKTYQLYFNTSTKSFYICSTTGSTTTAVWTLLSSQAVLQSLTDGQVLIGSTGNDPVPANLTVGANIGITNGAGSIEIALTGAVPSVSSPFNVGGVAVNSTAAQLNYLAALSAVPINKVVRQVITVASSYTPTTGMVFCIAEAIGGSGGGGGAIASSAAQTSVAGGGGAGSYASGIFTYAQIVEGGSVAQVTIGNAGTAGDTTGSDGGNGGTTILIANNGLGTTLLSAGGGNGGSGCPASASQQAISGGAGGTATVGQILIRGGFGGTAYGYANFGFVGYGGASVFSGSCNIAAIHNNSVAGYFGLSYGGGGSGGGSSNGSPGASGGVGSPGVVIITEFVSA